MEQKLLILYCNSQKCSVSDLKFLLPVDPGNSRLLCQQNGSLIIFLYTKTRADDAPGDDPRGIYTNYLLVKNINMMTYFIIKCLIF